MPRPLLFRRQMCRLCDGPRLEIVLRLAPMALAEKYVSECDVMEDQRVYPVDLYMCCDCGHVQLLDVVDCTQLFDNYTYLSAETAALVKHFDDCAAKAVARFKPTANSLVVDIGSNDGSLLRCFQSRGLRALGVDPAGEIAEKARRSGIPTLTAFLTPDLARKIRNEHGPAAFVTAFNVFAHADDLGEMVDSIREMLAPDGVFICEFSYLLDIVEHRLFGAIFHEHMSYHSVKPLVAFLKRHGIEMLDAERVPIQGGSIVGWSQVIGGPHRTSSNIDELITLEHSRGLDRPDGMRQLGTQLEVLRTKLTDLLQNLVREGKTFAGFGAARGGATLVAQLGLSKVIKFIVDDNPNKQHKFTPGDHLPVLPTSVLYEQKPDYTFILAWVHTTKIIEDHQPYLAQGGHFISCFPEIKIIDKNGITHIDSPAAS